MESNYINIIRIGKIEVHENDDIDELITNFRRMYGLAESTQSKIKETIIKTIENLNNY